MSFSGSCHCGAIAYTCEDTPESAMVCNCSICRRKGAVLHFTSPERVKLTAKVAPTIYLWNREVIAHAFCPVCGIATHAEVDLPDKPKSIAINLRASDVDIDALALTQFDGAAM